MNGVPVIFLAIGAGISLTCLLFASLFAIITAAGLNQRIGLISIFIPPVAWVYCFMNPVKARYPITLFFTGLAILLFTWILFIVIRLIA